MMHVATPISADDDNTPLDPLILSLLGLLLAFMPFALGTVHRWSELIAYALAALLAVGVAIRTFIAPGRSGVPRIVFVPIIAFIILAAIQLLPLPISIVRAISPHTARTQLELLRDVPGSETFLNRLTLSFHPLATRNTLRIVLLTSVIFTVVLVTCRSGRRIRTLLMILALIGAAMATLALAQDITGATKVYWLVDTGYFTHSGTFLHHSHFGQFMNLSIGAALALLLVRLRGTTTIMSDDYGGFSQQRFRDNIWWPMAVIIAGMAAIAISLTRGGVVAMCAAAPVTMLLLTTQRRLRKTAGLILLLMLLAGTCVAFLAFAKVQQRLATLKDPEGYSGRLQNVKDIATSFRQFPLVGSGIGTHETFFPRFQRGFDPMPSLHAENEYAEVAEEMGTAGVACVAMFVALVWLFLLHSAFKNDSPTSAAAIGLGYGLLAVMIHSLSDFGQHIPSVAGMSAATCALIINAARVDAPIQRRRVILPRRIFALLMLLVTLGISYWAVRGADAAFRAQKQWDDVDHIARALRFQQWKGNDLHYDVLITGLENAVNAEPSNVVYRYWLDVFRWHAINHAARLSTLKIDLNSTQLLSVESIVQDLHQARRLCPTYGPLYALAGELETFVLDRPIGKVHLRQAFALGLNDYEACFLAGAVDAREGDFESAKIKFRRSLALSGDAFGPIVAFYLHDVKRGDLAIDFASDSWQLLLRLRTEMSNRGEPTLAEAAKKRAMEVLTRLCATPDADAEALATLATLKFHENDRESSAALYERALELEPNKTSWRVERARALVALGRLDEATAETQIVLRNRNEAEGIDFLLGELKEAIRVRRAKSEKVTGENRTHTIPGSQPGALPN